MLMAWSGANGAFAGEFFFKTGESVIATQRELQPHFKLCSV